MNVFLSLLRENNKNRNNRVNGKRFSPISIKVPEIIEIKKLIFLYLRLTAVLRVIFEPYNLFVFILCTPDHSHPSAAELL